jgi:hypothetical protein
VVVDRDVDVLPADRLALDPGRVESSLVGIRLTPPVTRLPAPPWMRPSRLTSMWTSSPGRLCSYRTGCSRPSRARRPSPSRVRIPETVDSAIASVSAISAAVKRNLRSATIISIRSAGVRLATRRGAEERSSRPDSPSSR